MKKGFIYGVWTVVALLFLRAIRAVVPIEWRDMSNLIVMAFLSVAFLAFVVWAYRKGKFN